MLELVQGSVVERANRLTLGAGISLTQDTDGIPMIDVVGALTIAGGDARYGQLAGNNTWLANNVFNPGALQSSAAFSSYTGDGLFNGFAIPGFVMGTPGGANRKLIFGYQDAGGGQYAPAIGFLMQASGYTNLPIIRTLVSGEAFSRFTIYSSGDIQWGPGGSAADVAIYRGAADMLGLTGQLQSNAGIRATGWFSGGGPAGLGVEIGISGGSGYVYSYNRTTNVYGDITLSGFNVTLTPVSTGVITLSGPVYVGSGNDINLPGANFGLTNGTSRFLSVPSGASPTVSFPYSVLIGVVLQSASIVRSGTVGSVGYVQLTAGDATNAGYIEWYNAASVRRGYMGYFATGIGLQLESGDFSIFGAAGVGTIARFARLGGVFLSGTASIGDATNPVLVNRLFDSTTYGLVSFNGALTVATALGIYGRNNSTEGLYFAAPSGSFFNFSLAGSSLLTINGSGIQGGSNKGVMIGNSFFGQQVSGYGEVGYNNSNGGGAQNYLVTDFASRIRFNSGGISFQTAPSGSAGGAITFTERMVLSQTGTLTLTGVFTLIGTQNTTYNYVAGVVGFYVAEQSGYGIYVSAQNTLNFNYGINADSTGFINYRGYADGASRFRDLIICDGKQGNVAQFFAATGKGLRVYGYGQFDTDIFINQSPGYGLVGVYDPTIIQAVFAMGTIYRLTSGGAAGTLYGLGWTYDFVGAPYTSWTGHSLSHGLGIWHAGVLKTYIGLGIWTAGTIWAVGNVNAANITASSQLSGATLLISGAAVIGSATIGGYSVPAVRSGSATSVPGDLVAGQMYFGY